MDYIVFKFNFIWKLKLQFQFTHVHDIYYMNLKSKLNCKLKLQFEISNWYFNLQLKLNVVQFLANSLERESGVYPIIWITSFPNYWNWILGKFWKVHLKGKMFFSLVYGLHHFQIQFHLQIEIANWNFKLQFQFAISIYTCTWYTIHEFEIEFKLQIEIEIWDFNLQFNLNVGQILASSLKRESGFQPSIWIISFSNSISFENWNCNFKFQIAIWYFKLRFKFVIQLECWAIGKFT